MELPLDMYRLSCDCEYNLALMVRVMFGNFAKIERDAVRVQFGKISKHYEYY